MMPFHPSFRFLLRKYIPQVSNEDLDRHESLMALRLQLRLERSMRPETTRPDYPQTQRKSPRDVRNQLIREATVQANSTDGTGIFSGFEKEFNAVQQLWVARRHLALRPNPYSQTLSSLKRWKKLVESVLKYYSVRLGTFLVLETNRFRFFKRRILAVTIVLVLVGFILSQVVPSVLERSRGLTWGQEMATSPGSTDRGSTPTHKTKE